MSRNHVRENEGGRANQGNAVVSEDHIRLRAYEKFCKRGDAPGDPLADWLDAERELREEQRAARTSDKTRPSGAVAFSR